MNPKPSVTFGVVVFFISFGLLPAQNVSTSAPNEETITLNPFIVSTEDEAGYRATNTLDGSRLNTALRDTPGAISIFTRDLLDDLGATDVMEMLRYDVNAEEGFGDDEFGGPGNEIGKAGDVGLPANWRTRGLQASASTDGFITVGKSDMYNVESVGSTRGPNAILFGSGAAGGVLNLRTKTANPVRNLNGLEFKAGEYDTYRASADFNRVLIKDRLAIRVMAMAETRGSPRPYMYSDKESVTFSVQYKFAKETSLTASFENSRTEGISGRPWGPLDSVSRFTQELNAGRVVWVPARERYETLNGAVVGASSGAGNLATRTVLAYGPSLGEPALWEGTTSSANRTTLATSASRFNGTQPTVDESIAPYGSTQYSGEAEFGVVKFKNLTATFNHRWWDKLYMELAFNKSMRDSDANVAQNNPLRADLNYRLPNGSLNPYFFGNGYYFIQQGFLRQTQGSDNETMRAAFSYEVGSNRWWGYHRFALMAERHVANDMSYRTRHVWLGAPFGGTPESAANQIFRRRYFRIDGSFADYTGGYNPAGPFTPETYTSTTLGGRTLTSGWMANNNLNYDDEVTTDSGLFVMQNYLLDRRLVLTTGLRRDRIDSTSPNTVRDALTQEWRLATANDQPAFEKLGRSWVEETSEKGVRRSFGGVFHLTKNVSLTANASNGVGMNRRNRTVLPEEIVPDASRGEGFDYGVNFSVLENRISGSIKRYRSKSIREAGQNIVQPVFVNPNNDVMASFDYYLRKAGVTTFGAGAPISSIDNLRSVYFSNASGYLSDRVSEGYEFEAVANLTRNWTLRANYSYTERARTNVLEEGVAWWADRVELWKELDTLYVSRTGLPSIMGQQLFDRNDQFTTGTVAQRIADSDRELATTRLQEEQGYGNRKHKANVWTRYMFQDGHLKGLTIGGGWRYQSPNVSGIDLATHEIFFGNTRSLFDAMLSYRTRGLFGRFSNNLAVTYQLNVTNLLDDQTILITKTVVDTVTGERYPSRAWREDPRMATFTMRLDF